jgi:hypothetical protein
VTGRITERSVCAAYRAGLLEFFPEHRRERQNILRLSHHYAILSTILSESESRVMNAVNYQLCKNAAGNAAIVPAAQAGQKGRHFGARTSAPRCYAAVNNSENSGAGTASRIALKR